MKELHGLLIDHARSSTYTVRRGKLVSMYRFTDEV